MPADGPVTVVLDANVLYPFLQRDVLLSLASAGLFRARWTDAILAEWTRSLLVRRPQLQDNVERTVALMRAAFEECWVDGHEDLTEIPALPDPDDRHVLAAAIRCGAAHIVTNNLKDFPVAPLAAFGITAVSPDAFVADVVARHPDAARAALQAMRRRYDNPPMSRPEFLDALIRAGFIRTAAIVRQSMERARGSGMDAGD